jgi:hypothetical protein
LDEAFEALEGDEGLAEAMVKDEKQWDWLIVIAIESKLKELMIMRVSPEKRGGASANNGFMEEKMEPSNSREMYYQWKKDGADYQEFLQLQTAANLETEKKIPKTGR